MWILWQDDKEILETVIKIFEVCKIITISFVDIDSLKKFYIDLYNKTDKIAYKQGYSGIMNKFNKLPTEINKKHGLNIYIILADVGNEYNNTRILKRKIRRSLATEHNSKWVILHSCDNITQCFITFFQIMRYLIKNKDKYSID